MQDFIAEFKYLRGILPLSYLHKFFPEEIVYRHHDNACNSDNYTDNFHCACPYDFHCKTHTRSEDERADYAEYIRKDICGQFSFFVQAFQLFQICFSVFAVLCAYALDLFLLIHNKHLRHTRLVFFNTISLTAPRPAPNIQPPTRQSNT